VTARERLDEAAKQRMPRIARDQGSRARLDALEDYMLETAYHRGDLMEARLEVYELRHTLREEWDHLDGWQALKRTKTETAVEDATRQLRPDRAEQQSAEQGGTTSEGGSGGTTRSTRSSRSRRK
jgi:hypothetical protein